MSRYLTPLVYVLSGSYSHHQSDPNPTTAELGIPSKSNPAVKRPLVFLLITRLPPCYARRRQARRIDTSVKNSSRDSRLLDHHSDLAARVVKLRRSY